MERRDRLEDGTFGELKKIGTRETDKEKVNRLEAENAQLVYNDMMKDIEIEAVNQAQADLTYQLMQKGVL